MKKSILCFAIMFLALLFIGCDKTTETKVKTTSSATVTSTTKAPTQSSTTKTPTTQSSTTKTTSTTTVIEEPKYCGLTAEELDALKGVSAKDFEKAMNVDWNFGWDQATIEATNAKVDFANERDDASWHIDGGDKNAYGLGENGGWVAGLYSFSKETSVKMFTKIEIENVNLVNNFVIWGAVTGYPYRAGSGSLKVTVLYKGIDATYKEIVLSPTNLTANGTNELGNCEVKEDGSFEYHLLDDDQTFMENKAVPGIDDPNGMMLYDVTPLKNAGIVGDVVVMIELLSIEDVLTTENSNEITQWGVGTPRSTQFGVKRVMFFTEPTYSGYTAAELNEVESISTEGFDQAMNVDWNFGWDQATIEATNAKVDFANARDDASWHIDGGDKNVYGSGENGGWVAGLYSFSKETSVKMFNKINLDFATIDQFRIWACATGYPYRSGAGNLKVTVYAKAANGSYLPYVLTPTNLTETGVTQNGKAVVETNGSISFELNDDDVTFVENVGFPGLDNGDGMIIYSTSQLKLAGVSGECVVMIEFTATKDVLTTENSNEITQWGVGTPRAANVGIKRIMFIKSEVTPEPVVDLCDFTAEQLDAISGVSAENFAGAMNTDWNFGWDQATIEATAAKVDFTNSRTDACWHLDSAANTNGSFENGGWLVGMYSFSKENSVKMYNKVNLSNIDSLSQFRIWACTTGFPYRSGVGSIKVTVIAKNADGEYRSYVLTPANLGEGGITANGHGSIAEDGSYVFELNDDDQTQMINTSIPGINDPDGMMIYDISKLKTAQVSGDAVVVIEFTSVKDVLNTEAANAINNFGLETYRIANLGIKRIIFC